MTSASMLVRSWHASLVLAVAVAPPAAIRAADAPSEKSDRTEVRPLEKLDPAGARDARAELVEALGELIAQEDAKRQLLKELRAAFDGTAPMALRIHLVELMILKDQAEMLPLVSRSGETLRWDVARDLKHKERLAAERSELVRTVDAEIERLADRIVADEAADADELSALQRELLQRKLQRREAEAKSTEYADLAARRKQELADLDRLKRWIASNRREAAIRNERLRDAVEHEQTALLAEQVDAGRQRLKDALASFHARHKDGESAIVTSSENPVRDGIPVTGAVEAAVRAAPLTDEEQKLIEEELVKARERRAANQP